MFKLFDGREHLYQWDLDRKIIVTDPSITEVHFCNKTDDCAMVVAVYDSDGLRLADIPNILLQQDWAVRVYAYCGDCYTKQAKTFKVISRSRPADYVYTETEVKRWEALEERVNTTLDSVAEAEDARNAAEQARVEAEEQRVNEFYYCKDEVDAALSTANNLFTALYSYTPTVENHEKRITNIERHINNEYFVTDDSTAYNKPVADSACPYAQLNSISGMTYKPKNLFDIYRTDFVALNQDTLTNNQPKAENGVMYSGGVAGESAGAHIPIYLKPNTNYTFSCDISYNATTETKVVIESVLISNITNSLYTSADFTAIAYNNAQGHYSITFNSGNNIAFGVKPYSTNRYGLELRNVQLEEGTKETEYQPFFEGLQDTAVTQIKSYGANWLYSVKPRANTKVENGVVTQVNADTSTEYYFKLQGFKGTAYVKNVRLSDTVRNVGIYTMTFIKTSDVDNYSFGVNGSQIDTMVNFDAAHLIDGKTYTLSFNITNIKQGSISWCDIMLNEGSAALPYKPYREPITYDIQPAVQMLNAGKGIEGYLDTIDFNNKKYIQRCHTVALTGDENYIAGSYYIFAMTPNIPKGTTKSTGTYIITSAEAYPVTFGSAAYNTIQFGGYSDSIFNYFTDLDAFKAYVKERYSSGNPVTVTYALAEPIVMDLTWELDYFDNLLQVEGGGYLEFVNEYSSAAPSSVTYLLKEGSI